MNKPYTIIFNLKGKAAVVIDKMLQTMKVK